MKRLTALLITAAAAAAQPDRQLAIAREIATKAAASGQPSAAMVRPDAITGASAIDGLIAAWLLDRRGTDAALLAQLDNPVGVQLGANPMVSPGSSTSSTLRAAAPRVLGLALDLGMLSQSTSGQLVTVRGTPAGIAEALFGWKILHRPWDRLSAGATFDRGRQPLADGISARQLASWSVGFELINGRQARPADWLALLGGAKAYLDARQSLIAAMAEWLALREWQAAFAARLQREVDEPLAAGWIQAGDVRERIEQIARGELGWVARLTMTGAVPAALDEYARQIGILLQGRDRLRRAPRSGPVVGVDWTVLRPVNQPAHWVATAIAETTLSRAARVDLTSNFAYRSSGSLQAAVELSVPAHSGMASLSARAGGTTRYLRGTAFSAQATWTFPMANGIRLPVSLGLVRDPATGGIRSQVTLGLQWTTGAATPAK